MSEIGFFGRIRNGVVIWWRRARGSRPGRIVLNKYFIFTVFIAVYVLFITKNDIFTYRRALRDISGLQREKMLYQEQIISSQRRIEELKSDKDTLETFAREQYLFHEDGEDVYVVSKD